MGKILREVKGGYGKEPPEENLTELFLQDAEKPQDFIKPVTHTRETDPVRYDQKLYGHVWYDPYVVVWYKFEGVRWRYELNLKQWELFSNGRLHLIKQHLGANLEHFVYMYEYKFYISEIELSYEEFMLVVQKEILTKDKLKVALEKIKTEAEAEGYSREQIADDVQVFVWNRDGGKCVKCGSNENLEYDHIIPVSKGGSNTARNIQLLCQTCNRSKSNNIGG